MVRGQDTSSEFDLGAGGLLGLLAAPGAFNCFILLDKYSSFLDWYRGRLGMDPYIRSIPDKYLFLTVAMAVTGIVTILKWDRILPDPQDYLNLAPLPIPPRRILLANAAAILIAVMAVSLAVNAASVVLFPAFVSASARTSLAALMQFAAIHAVCVMLASIFSICAVFALMGLLSAVLPRDVFRASSSWVRGLLLIGLIALLLTGFAGTPFVSTLLTAVHSPLRFLPSLWFLGLYQTMQHRPQSVFTMVTPWALEGTLAAVLLMVGAYTASYRRSFSNVMEGTGSAQRSSGLRFGLAVLDWFAPRRPGFGRAGHRFAVRAILRSESHRLAIAVSVGLGCMLAFQDLPSVAAPLGVAYLLVLGLRIAFELPAGVPANWIFRAILDQREEATAGLARRVMLAFLVPIVLVPWLVYSVWQWGPAIAVAQFLYILGLSVCLIELMLLGYRKVPLTCPMPGFRDNLLMLCLLQFVGFAVFTRAGASLEHWMLVEPWRFALLPLAMAGAWWWNRQRLREALVNGELETGVTFENEPVRAVERLDLSS